MDLGVEEVFSWEGDVWGGRDGGEMGGLGSMGAMEHQVTYHQEDCKPAVGLSNCSIRS